MWARVCLHSLFLCWVIRTIDWKIYSRWIWVRQLQRQVSLRSPTRLELIDVRIHRHRVYRPSYYCSRPCDQRAINWCCKHCKLKFLPCINQLLSYTKYRQVVLRMLTVSWGKLHDTLSQLMLTFFLKCWSNRPHKGYVYSLTWTPLPVVIYLSYTFYVGTLSPDKNSDIPTVTDNLFAAGTITENVLSISFEPITDSSGTQINGELTWGAYIYYLRPWIWVK